MTQDNKLRNLYLYPFFGDKGRGTPGFYHLGIDLQNMDLSDSLFFEMNSLTTQALLEMQALEQGSIANIDEHRMVGHYWLRNPELSPTPFIREQIEKSIQNVLDFAHKVHRGEISTSQGPFCQFLVIGIGGSALGPQMVAHALGTTTDPLQAFFLDNTDPDGIHQTLANVEKAGGLAKTLVVVISKSGGTKETRNGMLEVQAAFSRKGLNFASHAVAITSDGSELYQTAKKEQWLWIFPMWDFIGGRTSELSAVGLLPAALQGIDIKSMLQGAKDMDVLTRHQQVVENPALLLAISWYHAAKSGRKDMVILPYKDRLELFSRYLQQLVMESLGKEKDRNGQVVEQGIAVYGNKGSTDQHAYVQQLRDGLNHFFVTFLAVLQDDSYQTAVPPIFVEESFQSGDYLLGFLLGTRAALHEKNRWNLTILLPEISPYAIGMLIALYERAVGFYASFVSINAYHQPGVEAGKTAAAQVLALQKKLLSRLTHQPQTVFLLCQDMPEQTKDAFYLLEHLAKNGRIGREKKENAAKDEGAQIVYFLK